FNFQYNPGFSYVQAAKSNQLNGPFTGQNFNQNNFRSNYNNRFQSRGPQRTTVNFNQSSNSNQNNASSNKGKEVSNKSTLLQLLTILRYLMQDSKSILMHVWIKSKQ